jgi:hypothetical protein
MVARQTTNAIAIVQSSLILGWADRHARTLMAFSDREKLDCLLFQVWLRDDIFELSQSISTGIANIGITAYKFEMDLNRIL